MLTKLSLRNAGRTWKDYLVFFVTLVLIAAIMFSFNGLLFDPNIRTLETDSYIIAVMLGIATFFILLVLAWLIQYMIRFMMKKRSREFATYLLLGMKRRQITHIFWGESLAPVSYTHLDVYKRQHMPLHTFPPLWLLFPRATSQVSMLAWIFGDCHEG